MRVSLSFSVKMFSMQKFSRGGGENKQKEAQFHGSKSFIYAKPSSWTSAHSIRFISLRNLTTISSGRTQTYVRNREVLLYSLSISNCK